MLRRLASVAAAAAIVTGGLGTLSADAADKPGYLHMWASGPGACDGWLNVRNEADGSISVQGVFHADADPCQMWLERTRPGKYVNDPITNHYYPENGQTKYSGWHWAGKRGDNITVHVCAYRDGGNPHICGPDF